MRFKIGKYKGQTYKDVMHTEAKYLLWAFRTWDYISPDFDDFMVKNGVDVVHHSEEQHRHWLIDNYDPTLPDDWGDKD